MSFLRRLLGSATQKVMSITFVGMLFGLAVDVLIAAKLGAGETTDALIVALSLPLLIDTVTREGGKFSMVPLFVEKQTTLTETEHQRFVSGLLNFSLLTGLIVSVSIGLFATWIIRGLAPGLIPDAQQEAVFLLRICAPLIVFSLGSTLLGVLLNSQQRFALVALRNAVTPALVVTVIWLMWDQHSIAPWVAAAYAAGFAIFFLTLLYSSYKFGYHHRWHEWAGKDDILVLWRTACLPTLGFISTQGTRILERVLASLVSVGGVSAYYFAFRVFSATQSLIGTSLATTHLPRMTSYSLDEKKSILAFCLRRNMVHVSLLSIPTLIGITVFHEEIIRLLYGHGTFDEAAIQQTSDVLLYLGAGLLFYCYIPVLFAGLYAQKAYGLVFRVMISFSLINITFAMLLWQPLGLIGLAIAVSVSGALAVGILIYFLHHSGVSLWHVYE